MKAVKQDGVALEVAQPLKGRTEKRNEAGIKRSTVMLAPPPPRCYWPKPSPLVIL
jgi:hypothetical protein